MNLKQCRPLPAPGSPTRPSKKPRRRRATRSISSSTARTREDVRARAAGEGTVLCDVCCVRDGIYSFFVSAKQIFVMFLFRRNKIYSLLSRHLRLLDLHPSASQPHDAVTFNPWPWSCVVCGLRVCGGGGSPVARTRRGLALFARALLRLLLRLRFALRFCSVLLLLLLLSSGSGSRFCISSSGHISV